MFLVVGVVDEASEDCGVGWFEESESKNESNVSVSNARQPQTIVAAKRTKSGIRDMIMI